MRKVLIPVFLVFILIFPPLPVSAVDYYVDSSIGSDSNSCTDAQNTATPKQTVDGVMSCNPGAGDIVKFRGTFTSGIYPTQSGQVLYQFQPIQSVSGTTVTFNQPISGLNPATDYVTIYNSRKGNSGAFAVISSSGNTVTVDNQYLPLGQFITETAADPGDLSGAILRPVHFTAWDKQNPPIFNTPYQTFYSNSMSVVMVSYLHSISGEDYQVWPAIEIDSLDLTPSDYIILDHLEIENAATAIATESRHFQSNYDIIQHNNIHDIGYQGLASDEAIYFGYDIRLPVEYHDYVQIVYNKIGPHRFTTDIIGDGIEIKESARYATVFGNEVFGIQSMYCADAPIRISGIDAFVANNFVHDISPGESRGCGISIIDDYPSEPTTGAKRAIVMNNILANVRGMGIRILDANGVQILHNTIYNIIYPEPNGDPAWTEEYGGILVQNWQGPTENIIIKNNIVHSAHIGIGRYIWSHDYPVSIDSDYNIVFNTTYPFRGDTDSRGTITQNTHDLLLDPGFVNPSSGNFYLQSSSPAIDNGTVLSDVAIDFDYISRPQGAGYDIGAYEYQGTGNVWYVQPAGGNYGNEDGTSYANAWDGLNNVVWGAGGVQAGDTLYICGLHHRTFNGASLWEIIGPISSGTPGNIITIRGDCPGDQGIIWGSGVLAHEAWVDEGSNTYSITIPSGMYSGWLFEDVAATSWTLLDKENTLQDCKNNPGSYYSANYQTGTKLYVHTSDEGIPTNRISFPRAGYMFSMNGTHHIKWQNLKFYYLYRTFLDWGNKDVGSYLTWDNVTMWYGEGGIMEFRGNDTHHIEVLNSDIAWSQNGLVAGPQTGGPSTDCAHDYTFSGNYIHDIGVRVTHPDAHCIGIQGGYNNVIEKNTCVNCGTGPLLYADGSVQSIKDTIIRWNLVKDCHTLGSATGYGISFMCDGPNVADKSGNQVYGNIVTNCTDAYRYKWEYQTVFYNNIAHNCDKSFRIYRGSADTVAPNIEIRNHISLNPTTYHIEFYSPLAEGNYVIDSDYNIFYPISGNQFQFIEVLDVTTTNFAGWQSFSKSGCTFDPHSLTLDPLLQNPSNSNFRPTVNSPAIDNGTNVGLTKDYDGNPLPQGTGFDIGAFEYLSGFTLLGDLNGDGYVDIYDLILISYHFGERRTHFNWNESINTVSNDEIDIFDVVFVASRFT